MINNPHLIGRKDEADGYRGAVDSLCLSFENELLAARQPISLLVTSKLKSLMLSKVILGARHCGNALLSLIICQPIQFRWVLQY